MFEHFNTEARGVVARAGQQAGRPCHEHVGTGDLLLALLSPQAGLAYAVLDEAGVRAPQVRAEIERLARRPILDAADAAALRTVGIDLDAVLARIEETFGPAALSQTGTPARRRRWRRRAGSGLSNRAKKVLELAFREALALGHGHVGPEHILLGLLRDGGGLAARILTEAGIRLADLRSATLAATREAA